MKYKGYLVAETGTILSLQTEVNRLSPLLLFKVQQGKSDCNKFIASLTQKY
jgi:hypothetical protein